MKPALAGLTLAAIIGASTTVTTVQAQGASDLLAALERAARSEQPSFGGFSAERGKTFFAQSHGGDWSCASCHTGDPRAAGRHAVTGKPIEPLAPSAHAARLTDAAKVDKWFRRNCRDVLARECTAAEKGDVVAYLVSLPR